MPTASATAITADPVIMAAGDVACSGCKHKFTSDLILKQQADDRLDGVLAFGDLQYENASLSEFMASGQYNDTWGRFAAKTFPAPGNHEYQTSGAKGYFDYFKNKGVRTGKGEVVTLRDGTSVTTDGWYSFDIGNWHFVSLNTSNNCSPVSCAAGSAQERWLRDDLATTTKSCIAAEWHHPYKGTGSMGALWKALADAKADVVFTGHEHSYTRRSIRDGIQEFTVGTGGQGSGAVMRLVLHTASYDFTMVGNESDSGARACNLKRELPMPPPPPPSPTPPPPPASGVTLVHDTKAYEGSPTRNYGQDTTLRVKTASGSSYRSFLQFTVKDLPGPVTAATLRLKAVTQKSGDGGAVFVVGDTLADGTPWTESNLLWSNMPMLPASSIGTAGAVDPAVNGGIVNITLKPEAFAGGDGTYSLALRSGTSTSAYYASKEAGSGAPQLILTTGTASPPPAPPPPPPPAPPPPPPPPPTPPPPPSDLTITLTDDTKTKSTSPTSTYGSETTLRTRFDSASGGINWRSFLKFRVAGLTGKTLVSATLRLTAVTQKSDDGGSVFAVSDLFGDGSAEWTESTLTWAKSPALPSTSIGQAGPVDPTVNGGVVNITLDPTAFDHGDGVYSLALSSRSTASAYYSSKEGATPPVLMLTTS